MLRFGRCSIGRSGLASEWLWKVLQAAQTTHIRIKHKLKNGSLYYLWEFLLCKVHVGDIVDLGVKEGDDLLRTHGVDHKPQLGDVVQVSTVGRGLRDRRNYWSLK